MKDLKEQRELAGLTQFSLSRRSGVSRMRLSLAECSEIDLDPEEKAAVRQILLAAIEARMLRLQMVLISARTAPDVAEISA
jgi:transcriptional regulator with XRE-family HTH domain